MSINWWNCTRCGDLHRNLGNELLSAAHRVCSSCRAADDEARYQRQQIADSTPCEICERPTTNTRWNICADCWRDHQEEITLEGLQRKALACVESAKAIADALTQDEATEAMPYDPPDFWRTVVGCASCHATEPVLVTDRFFLSFGVCCDKEMK